MRVCDRPAMGLRRMIGPVAQTEPALRLWSGKELYAGGGDECRDYAHQLFCDASASLVKQAFRTESVPRCYRISARLGLNGRRLAWWDCGPSSMRAHWIFQEIAFCVSWAAVPMRNFCLTRWR